MYNFNFIKNEKLIEIFEEVHIKQNNQEKTTTIALTNKRLLFLDYVTNNGLEALRIINKLNIIKSKEVYYEIYLTNIKNITKETNCKITLKDNTSFEFNNDKLYKLLGDK